MNLSKLARRIQMYCPVQPGYGPGGHVPPAPVTITYDQAHEDQDRAWHVKYVAGVKGPKKQWGYASGPTVETALRRAHDNLYGKG